MKRLVICYDGTWNAVTNPDEVTNVVRMAQAIKSVAEDGTTQVVYYNAGVGSGGPIDRFVGGVFGAGLRNNVKRGLAFLSLNWEPEEPPDNPVADEIYIFGFSRGAYSARALAGVIGAIGGIPRQASFDQLGGDLEPLPQDPGGAPAGRRQDQGIDLSDAEGQEADHQVRRRVGYCRLLRGSRGTGPGRARPQVHLLDARLPRQRDRQEHRVRPARDGHRRGAPRLPGDRMGDDRREGSPGVEQVWFAGAHSNVGGGYKESGLSDMALLWMISRVAELTGLEFDDDYIKQHFWPCAACSLYRSNKGWLISSIWPFRRPIPEHLKAPVKGAERLVNAKVHWSVKQRHGKSALVDQKKYLRYTPKNLPADVDYTEPSHARERLHQHVPQRHEPQEAKGLRPLSRAARRAGFDRPLAHAPAQAIPGGMGQGQGDARVRRRTL